MELDLHTLAEPRHPSDFGRGFVLLSTCELDGDCWRWMLPSRPPHRQVYDIFVDEIPAGARIVRQCGNVECVNPDHLVAVGRSDGEERRRFYATPSWKAARRLALERDEYHCTVGWLFGTPCSKVLHVHHIIPLAEGGAPYDLDNLGTTCGRHHKTWEVLRSHVHREIARTQGVDIADELMHRTRCPHRHTSTASREQCERRRRRQLARRERLAA